MLINLKVENFKKLEQAEFNFTAGLNILKGDNEAGKSTLLDAIGYALWGTRFLELSLDETVTWGKPVNTLRVTLTFTVEGKQFTIKRSDSGAELTGVNGELATGKTETTNFIERLLGASLTTAKSVLFATQNNIRGSLEGGAIPLIEKLSNMQVLDELVGKIQTTLPSGNTKALEANLAEMEDELKVPIPVDFTAMGEELELLKKQVANLEEEAAKIKILNIKGSESVKFLYARLESLREDQRVHKRNVETLQKLNSIPEEVVPEFKDVSHMNALKLRQQENRKLKKALDYFDSASEELADAAIDNTYITKDLQTLLLDLDSRIEELTKKLVDLPKQILEVSCGFCGKNLAEIPEVQEHNRVTFTENSRLKLLLAEAKTFRASTSARLDVEYKNSARRSNVLSKALINLSGFVKLEGNKFTWTAGKSPVEDTVDYDTLINTELALRKTCQEAISRNAVRKAQIESLTNEINSYVEVDTSDIVAKLDEYSALNLKWSQVNSQLSTLDVVVNGKTKDLTHERIMYKREVEAYESSKEKIAKAKDILDQYKDNNALIKKLRDIRPLVAKRLWNTILASVSQTLSQIRGQATAVTRSNDKFLLDGKAVAAYSGSTQDSLGLAIRLTLQKVFLPALDFLLLDEPAAGMAERREVEMLAAVATSGVSQVLLVTHSNLADSFAENLISL